METKTDSFSIIASELSISTKQVQTVVTLLEEGATLPFIARYRKEMTGSLDEVQISHIRDRHQALQELEKRRDAILKSLQEMGKLNAEFEAQIRAAVTIMQLEDLYLPYRPRRKTRASVARERGLEPLAELLMLQGKENVLEEAARFIDEEKSIKTAEEALAGARDIVAEQIAENAEARALVRALFLEKGNFRSHIIEGKEEQGQKFRDYFDWTEPIKSAPSHRVLAMRRGEKEEVLSLELRPAEEDAVKILSGLFLKSSTEAAAQVNLSLQDSYKRLLSSSMETEVRLLTRRKADEEAIKVFASNVRQLLLAAPLGQKNVMAIDPGFRTGCKLVCLDTQGKLIEYTTIFPHTGAAALAEAEKTLIRLCAMYKIQAIAIGNGTAGRETEAFVRQVVNNEIPCVMVNESGASIYSASDVAREEFPDQDLTVRGAVSIGRRLMDPLAELVKINPQSIGVGQYQHDVDQSLLQASLDDAVISCVNKVGVELNTASKQILSYISGLGPVLAQNIVEYRNTNGAFKSRHDLKKVNRLGEKAFEQAAGFLRIRDAENVLDASAVHPERYELVEKMASDLGSSVKELIGNDTLRKQIPLKNYVNETVGLPTLQDILAELARPGRDPRESFEVFQFEEGVNSIADLKIGMKLNGIITNITNFGAFVDIGVHQDGLVHLSQLSNRFIKDPNEVVKVQQRVEVTVTEVDAARKRIALSMKTEEKPAPRREKPARPNAARKSEDGLKGQAAHAQKANAPRQASINRPASSSSQNSQKGQTAQKTGIHQNHKPDQRKQDFKKADHSRNSQKHFKQREEKEPETDMAIKLAALRDKFK